MPSSIEKVSDLVKENQIQLYRDLVEASQDLIWQCDADGRYTYLNPAWEETFGYSVEEMLGKKFTDFQTPEQAQKDIQEFNRLMQGNMVKGLETVHLGRGNREIHLIFNAIFIRDKNGNICGTRGTAHDITSTKNAEKALLESERRLRSIIDSAPFGAHLYEVDTYEDLIFSGYNKSADSIIGVSHEQFIGKKITEAFPPLAETEIPINYFNVAKTGQSYETEQIAYEHKEIKGAFKVHAVQTAQNHMAAFFIDITESKKAETALRKSEEKFRLIAENSRDMIYRMSLPEGLYEYVSPSSTDMFGYTPDEFIKSPLLIKNAIHPDWREYFNEQWKALLDGNMPPTYEYQIVHGKTKETRWLHQRNVLISNDEGKPVAIEGIVTDITERKQIESELQKNEAMFRKLINSTRDTILLMEIETDGSTTNFKLVNDAACENLGYTRAELLQLSPNEIDIVGRSGLVPSFGEKLLREKHVLLESEHIAKDGHTFPVEVSLNLFQLDGKPFNLAIARDITERKRTEEALRKSEQTFSIIFKKAPFAAGLIKISDNTYLEVNEEFLRLFGFSRAEVIGKTSLELDMYPDPEIQERSKELFREQGFIHDLDMQLQTRTGEAHDVVINSDLVEISGEKYILTTAHDITGRKQAEKTIAEEREQLSVTLRSIGDGVITTDTNGNVAILNKVAEELTGWKQAEVRGKPLASIFNIINEITREPIESPVEKVLSTGQITELANHTLLISRDGTERIIADSGAPIKDKESRTIGVVLVFRDMTEKDKLQSDIQRIDRLDSIGILAGGIAHDFNNLLGGIFGYIDLAREECDAEKNTSTYLDKAAMVYERAKDLTLQLLTFSKGGEPKLKTGHLGKLIRDNATFVLSGTNVNYSFDIAPDLLLCDFDENQIGQVVDNIVINAQQAMPMGGTIFITVNNVTLDGGKYTTLKGGNYIKISIKDTGVGIPQNLLKHIFDPFFTTKHKGNGLGLSTCYSIIKKHDGSIEVESIPGNGTAFHIFLPVSLKDTINQLSQPAVQHEGSGTIIVMDDESFMREIVSGMFATMGYSLIEAKDGEEAIQLCEEALKQGKTVRAALFDLTIPGGMGGKEAVLLFRERFPCIPAFASSGYSEDPAMARPTEFGFTDSIRKPFKKDELAEMMNKHFKS